MSNFEKRLEEASEEDLRRWINEYDFRVVPLASDELTRRSLEKLQKVIQDLDKNTKHYSGRLIDLTILLFFTAVIQTLIYIIGPPETWLMKGLLAFIVVYAIYYMTRRIVEEKKSKN